MYSFAQRADTIVFDEPLYAYYLSNTAAKKYHPDAELIINSMENNGEKVIDIMTGNHKACLLYTSPSPRDLSTSRMPSSA